MIEAGQSMGEDARSGAGLVVTMAGLALFWTGLIYGALHIL